MRRIAITIATVIVGVVLIQGGGLAFKLFCSPPSVEVSGDSHKKEFYPQFLGEYCYASSNITLTDATTNSVIWSVEVKPGVGFCRFSLVSGSNSAFREGVSRVIVPANETTFILAPQTKYKITVRPSGLITCRGVGSATFEF